MASHSLLRAGDQSGSRAVCFKASIDAAGTPPPARDKHHMTQLAAAPVPAAENFPMVNKAAADARTQSDHEGAFVAAGNARKRFAQSGAVCVVRHVYRLLEPL